MGFRPRRIDKAAGSATFLAPDPTSVLVLTLALVWLAPAGAAAQWSVTSCSAVGENLFVRDVLTDVYLWATAVPAENPSSYPSPEAYLEAVRYRPLDSHFSFITSRQANAAFYGASQYVGLGVTWAVRGNELRVLQVFPDSPASEAGMARGDRILAINGQPVADLIATNSLDFVLADNTIGTIVAVQFASVTGSAPVLVRMVKRVVTIPTVGETRVLLANGRRIGYLFFRNFVAPSPSALDAAFAQLVATGIDDLVIDLRYNGGGLVSVAQHLASLVGGTRTRGQVLAEYTHNDRNRYRNTTLRFEDAPQAATLSRLIAITTPATASASELVINALRPYIPVVTVGDRTYGKPVGQYQIDFCDKTLFPVSFSVRNARGEGDYFNGLPADCPAADDVDHQLGDPAEASLREAIVYAVTGACSPAPVGLRGLRSTVRPPPVSGWQSLINAY